MRGVSTGRLLTAGFLADIGSRVSAVTIPLVTLVEIDSVAATGLVGGVMSIPVVTSPWWARNLRRRMNDGRALAIAMTVQMVGVLVVPVTLLLGVLAVGWLVASGLLNGAGLALCSPGIDSLVADHADRRRLGGAVRALSIREILRRVAIAIGPLGASLGILLVGPRPMLWVEASCLAVGALLLARVPAAGDLGAVQQEGRTRIWAVLRTRPELLRGLAMRSVGSLIWFSYALGFVVMGNDIGNPGAVLSATSGGYGVGAVLGSALATILVRRVRPLPLAAASWTGFGIALVAMGVTGVVSLPLVAAISAVGGLAMAVGITAIVRQISETGTGQVRNAAFSGQLVILETMTASGMLVGGAVIAAFGPRPTLVACGMLMVAVCMALLLVRTPLRGPR